MAKVGRPAKPNAIKRLEGNPGKRPLPDEPKYELGVGEPPDDMDEVAREHWREYAPILTDQGVLTIADRPMWIQLCTLWADWVHAREDLAEHGKVQVSDKGWAQQSPYFSMASNLRKEYEKLVQLFGMTPSDRTSVDRIEMPEEGGKDDPLRLTA